MSYEVMKDLTQFIKGKNLADHTTIEHPAQFNPLLIYLMTLSLNL